MNRKLKSALALIAVTAMSVTTFGRLWQLIEL